MGEDARELRFRDQCGRAVMSGCKRERLTSHARTSGSIRLRTRERVSLSALRSRLRIGLWWSIRLLRACSVSKERYTAARRCERAREAVAEIAGPARCFMAPRKQELPEAEARRGDHAAPGTHHGAAWPLDAGPLPTRRSIATTTRYAPKNINPTGSDLSGTSRA